MGFWEGKMGSWVDVMLEMLYDFQAAIRGHLHEVTTSHAFQNPSS